MSLILLTTIIFSIFFHQVLDAPLHLNLGELRPSSCKEPLGCEFCNKFDECISCQNEYYFMQVGGEDSETVRCLENCFPHQFSKFVGNKQECIDCHPACVDGCTGPNATISKGGCNKCLYGVMNGQTKTCLIKSNDMSSACEKGYFHEKATGNYSMWTYHICLECEKACQTCESAGIHPVTNKCVCKNYLAIDYTKEQKKFCVEDCPSGYVEVLRSNEDPLCLLCNKDETVDFSARKCSKQADTTEIGVIIGLVLTTSIVIIGLVIYLCAYRWFKRRVHRSNSIKSTTPIKNKTDTMDSQRLAFGSPEMDKLIPNNSQNYEKVSILEHQLEFYKDAKGEKIELGRGYFGKVYKGIFIKDNTRLNVAIKVIEKDEPIREAMIELALCHAMIPPYTYVNKLIGICDVSQKPLQVIYNCRKGNLKNYCFALEREGKKLDLWQMYLFCAQIANGMDYLANKHNIIHKNLMASSILIESADHVVISSFGLIRYVKNDVLRINVVKWPWLAIELFNEFTFTKQTDIWSYGIVGWEIFENCSATPYKKKNIKNKEELKEFLTQGSCLPKPKAIKNKNTYDKLKKCWSTEPNDRPSFGHLYEYFHKMALKLREGLNEVLIDESKNGGGPGVKFNLSHTSPQTEYENEPSSSNPASPDEPNDPESEDEPSSSNPASPAESNDSEDSENETPADNFRKTNPPKHSEADDLKKQTSYTSIDSGLDEKCDTLKRAKTNNIEKIQVDIETEASPNKL